MKGRKGKGRNKVNIVKWHVLLNSIPTALVNKLLFLIIVFSRILHTQTR